MHIMVLLHNVFSPKKDISKEEFPHKDKILHRTNMATPENLFPAKENGSLKNHLQRDIELS